MQHSGKQGHYQLTCFQQKFKNNVSMPFLKVFIQK
jgi:hypothetical protein